MINVKICKYANVQICKYANEVPSSKRMLKYEQAYSTQRTAHNEQRVANGKFLLNSLRVPLRPSAFIAVK